MNVSSNKRIDILDSFRALAILGVVFYHFFYRWNDAIYPYLFSSFFHYGLKGVPFFFMISGFVICYSLENTNTFLDFWKKRFVRLFPSMFVATLLTYLFVINFDVSNIFYNSHYFRNFLVSLTFLLPNIFDFLFFKKIHFSYTNNCYWSLWPEIQFYLFVSLVYFYNRKRFLVNFISISSLLILCYALILFLNLNTVGIVQKVINLFSLVVYLKFFLAGSLFYQLYKKEKVVANKYLFIILFLLYVSFFFPFDVVDVITISIFYLLFLSMIFEPNFLFFLNFKFFKTIGVSSYFLYLIHEYIGVILIQNIVFFFHSYSFVAPLIVIAFFVIFSILYTNYIEKRLSQFVFKKINKQ